MIGSKEQGGTGMVARTHQRPTLSLVTVAGLGGLGLFVVLAGAVPGGRPAAAGVYTVMTAGGIVLLLTRARRVRTGRGAWALMAVGVLMLVACQGALVLVSRSHGQGVGITLGAFRDHPWLALSGLAAYPVIYAGQMALLRQRVEGMLPSAWLDGLMVSVLLLAVMAAFVVPPLRTHFNLGTAGAVALVARPVLDLLMAAFAFANWSLSGWLSDRRLPLVAAALTVLLLSDTAGVFRLLGIFGDGSVDVAANTGRLFAIGLLVTAVGLRTPSPDGRSLEGGGSHLIAPTIVMISSGTLIMIDTYRDLGSLSISLCVAALAGVGMKFALLYREVLRLADSRRQALTDDLTNLANRRALSDALRGIEGVPRPVSLLVIDLDQFKTVNDRFGHTTGDALLRHTARCLTDLTPPRGLLARTGGDEFALLLPGRNAEEAVATAAAIVEQVSVPVIVNGHPLRSTTSIGIVTFTGGLSDDLDADELARRADVAMYLAKAGGGGLAVYDQDVDAAARRRSLLLEELRVALDPAATPSLHHQDPTTEQIHAHYQPQVDATTGVVVGVEALVRWRHPRLGLLTPDAFLDLVEEGGLMAELTTRVLWSAAEQTVRWHEAGHRLRLAVNLSTSCLANPDFLALLDDVLVSTGLDPAALVVEITETTLMVDPQAALQTARAITARGVGLSIDDYGTGYSSMAYLNDLPATELKLDRTFTTRLLHDERTAAITATAIDLAHRLGMRLIAEGVEDEATLLSLRDFGADETQGYHHSQPLPALDFTQWLSKRTMNGAPTMTTS